MAGIALDDHDDYDDDRRRWDTAGWQQRVEQAILFLIGTLLAAWAFDRTGGGVPGFTVVLAIMAIALAAGWHGRSGRG